MFRPPFIARVAAGAAVYALEEARRLPATAMHLPITAISQLLQTTMHAQQFVTSLALKGDEVFDQLVNRAEEQPEWATFDEDLESRFDDGQASPSLSRFDLYAAPEPQDDNAEDDVEADSDQSATAAAESADTHAPDLAAVPDEVPSEPESSTAAVASTNGHTRPGEVAEPEVATRYDYLNMTLAQLRARLRMLSVTDLDALLDYERRTRDRAAFVTMLTNRIATVQAK